ncbi:hypothetical protein KOW79_019164, partial [Hemibagrus wyckioides]
MRFRNSALYEQGKAVFHTNACVRLNGAVTPDTTQSTTPTELQQSIEALYISVRQRTQILYHQNDSSKIRHPLRRKLAEDKKLLLEEIYKYNSVVESTKAIDFAKKKMHDQVLLMLRLQEEKSILVLEMVRHCTWLQNLVVVLKKKVAEEGKFKKNYSSIE